MTNKIWFRKNTNGYGWTPVNIQGWLVVFLSLLLPFIHPLVARILHLEYSALVHGISVALSILFSFLAIKLRS